MINGHGDTAVADTHIYRYNFSSNIYGHTPPQGLVGALHAAIEDVGRYPEPVPEQLERKIAERYFIDPETVLVTAGATEAIYLIARLFKGKRSCVVQPTFAEYADACAMHGHKLSFVTDYRKAADCDVVWMCNPNNPTGKMVPSGECCRFIGSRRNVDFVIDQSYCFFTKRSALPLRISEDCPNVLLIHSLTKEYAIPGLRLGFVVGSKKRIRALRCRLMPWRINTLAMAAGFYAMEHEHPLAGRVDDILRETNTLRRQLNSIDGVKAHPTETHFFLLTLRDMTAARAKALLQERDILVRDASNFYEMDDHTLRIATQEPEANEALVQALRDILKEAKP